ncbi:RNase H domain-containing protein [Trichonephila clavipes]|nr:RNase H domain-containing protein [Trichonephila clavipes]
MPTFYPPCRAAMYAKSVESCHAHVLPAQVSSTSPKLRFAKALVKATHSCPRFKSLKKRLVLNSVESVGFFQTLSFLLGSLIKVVNEFKFLGLIFDKSLRFHRHLKDLKIRNAKALNILKVLANTRWGADRISLLRLYRVLIRSKLDEGSVVYSSACKSLLKNLGSSTSSSHETLSGSLPYITG